MVKQSAIFAFAVALLAATIAQAQDKVHLPQDIPPTIAMATAKELPDDPAVRYQIELVLPSIQYEVVRREFRAGKVASWNEVIAEVKPCTRILNFGTPSQIPDSEIVGFDGKPLSTQAILTRLKKQSPVLVSVSGRMVDPYYLQLAKEDVVIILLSRKDGKGNRTLLPNHKKGLAAPKER